MTVLYINLLTVMFHMDSGLAILFSWVQKNAGRGEPGTRLTHIHTYTHDLTMIFVPTPALL